MNAETLINGRREFDSRIGQDSIVLSFKNPNKEIRARIAPHFGSNIYEFTYNGQNIFYSEHELLKERDWTGCLILWPLPNRVRDKKYEFEGNIISLSGIKRKRGNFPLIHGLVDDKIWETGKIEKNGQEIKASTFININPASKIFQYYPFQSRLNLYFILNEKGIKIEYIVENYSDVNMPFGFALHPYLNFLSPRNHTKILLPAESYMDSDSELLPTGGLIEVNNTAFDLNHPRPVSDLSLDHVFTNLDRSKTPYIDYADQKLKVFLESSEDFTHAVIYTGEQASFCFENQTGSTDMINLHTRGIKENNTEIINAAHLIVVPPKKQHTGYIFYRVEKY